MLLLEVTRTGLDASDTRSDLGQMEDSCMLSVSISWKAAWCRTGIAAPGAGLLTSCHSLPGTNCDTWACPLTP